MNRLTIMFNILGLIVALLGVFIEPVAIRFFIVGIGTFLASIRIIY